jgi:hypothetical protein
MNGLAPGLESAVRFPVNMSAKAPEVIAPVGVIGPISDSALNENVKVPPPLFVVGTITVKVGIAPVPTGRVKVLRVAVDPFGTSRFPAIPAVV